MFTTFSCALLILALLSAKHVTAEVIFDAHTSKWTNYRMEYTSAYVRSKG